MSTDLATRFYEAFAARDHATMNACYAPDATFRDPVFDLRGDEIATMWTALCTSGKDLVVTHELDTANDRFVRARWQATYTFRATGRKVVNDVRTRMELVDGVIVAQVDEFSFHRWAAQALGAPGLLLGWAPPFRAKVAAQARRGIGL